MTDEQEKRSKQSKSATKVKQKLARPVFVDDVTNITISPNGACRINFVTWSTGKDGRPKRTDSEIIMTLNSLQTFSDSLVAVLSEAGKKKTSRPEGEGETRH